MITIKKMKYIRNLNEINNTDLKFFDNNKLEELLVRKSIDYNKCISIVKEIEKSIIEK
jgi:hypothetical protein